ncbi:hypothetical protein ACOSQ3_004130 [Xanthoceras sorbifolium]
MDLEARRCTRNDILKDIYCLIAPPIYSFIYKGCRNEDCGRALLFLLLERYSRIKLEADQKDIVVEIVFSCLQLIVSGVSNSSLNTSTNSLTDQLIEIEDTDQLQLSGIQIDPSKTLTDQISNVEDTKTLQLSNICDVKPSGSQSNEVQQIPYTMRNISAQSDDQGQVDPSNTRIAQTGNAEDTNPSSLSNTCEQSDTPNKNFVPSRSHSDEVQQVPNMLRKRRNTFTQSDQGEENELNFRRRDSCQRCGEPRIGYHKGSFGGRISGRGPDVRPGLNAMSTTLLAV